MKLLGDSSSLTTTAERPPGSAQKLSLPPARTLQSRAVRLQRASLPMRVLQSQGRQRNSRVTWLPAAAHIKQTLGYLAWALMRCGGASTSIFCRADSSPSLLMQSDKASRGATSGIPVVRRLSGEGLMGVGSPAQVRGAAAARPDSAARGDLPDQRGHEQQPVHLLARHAQRHPGPAAGRGQQPEQGRRGPPAEHDGQRAAPLEQRALRRHPPGQPRPRAQSCTF